MASAMKHIHFFRNGSGPNPQYKDLTTGSLRLATFGDKCRDDRIQNNMGNITRNNETKKAGQDGEACISLLSNPDVT